MSDVIQVVIGGLVVGCVYALIALSMSLVYSVSKVIDLSQGAFVVLAAIASVSLGNALHISAVPLLIVTAVIFAVGMTLVDTVIVRPATRRTTPDRMLLVTVGVLQAVGGILLIFWGNLPYTAKSFSGAVTVTVAGLRLSTQFFWVAGVLVVTLIALWVLLQRTSLGLRMRATAQDPQAAALMGVNTDHVRLVAYAVAGAMVAMAGVAIMPLTFLQFDTVVPYAVNGFIAAVIGGLGSRSGAVLGGLLLGVLQGVLQRYTSASVAQVLAIAALIAVLLLRPAGLRGQIAQVRR